MLAIIFLRIMKSYLFGVWLITASTASARIGTDFDHIDTAKQGQGYESIVSRYGILGER